MKAIQSTAIAGKLLGIVAGEESSQPSRRKSIKRNDNWRDLNLRVGKDAIRNALSKEGQLRNRDSIHTEADVKDWFRKLRDTLQHYRICKAKYIYNMDETGARLGCPPGETVVVPVGVDTLHTESPENRKSVTVIETICEDGNSILAMPLLFERLLSLRKIESTD